MRNLATTSPLKPPLSAQFSAHPTALLLSTAVRYISYTLPIRVGRIFPRAEKQNG